MPDLLNPNKVPKKLSAMHVMTCIGLSIICLCIYYVMQSSKPNQNAVYRPRASTDLTGVYYGYSQLANLQPTWWELRLIQPNRSIDFEGNFLIINGTAGVAKGSVDDSGNIQFILSLGAKSSPSIIPGADILSSAFSGSKSAPYHFIGNWKKSGKEIFLKGVVVNLAPRSEEETKQWHFYASTTRSSFWGKDVN
jgi:hypothetical protein